MRDKRNVIEVYIPDATIKRISMYLRCLRVFKEYGKDVVQSREIAEKCGFSSSLVRKDLSYFGEFGIRGKGYDVENLIKKIEDIIDLHEIKEIIVIGAGNLGRALVHHFEDNSTFNIVAVFDKDKRKIGKYIKDIEIKDIEYLSSFLTISKPLFVILAIPPGNVQDIVDILVKGGIKGILSFVVTPISVPKNVEVSFVEIASELEFLGYKIKCMEGS